MNARIANTDSINALCYELAHDLDLNEKEWIIPALKSHVHQLAKSELIGYDEARVERLICQWILVRQCKLNPVPRSLP